VTDLGPEDLLRHTKQIEVDIGRRKLFQNGPRPIDIDILFYNDLEFSSEILELPHPAIAEREFVLQPLHEYAIEFKLCILCAFLDFQLGWFLWRLVLCSFSELYDFIVLPLICSIQVSTEQLQNFLHYYDKLLFKVNN
jgi:hypothetical protein